MGTFGDTNIETQTPTSDGQLLAVKWVAPKNGIVTFLSAYTSGDGTLGLGMYSDNAGMPDILLASGSIAFPPISQWVNIAVNLTKITSGSVYWLSFQRLSGSAWAVYYYNAGGATGQFRYFASATDFLSPWNGGDNGALDRFISEYATYIEMGAVVDDGLTLSGYGWVH